MNALEEDREQASTRGLRQTKGWRPVLMCCLWGEVRDERMTGKKIGRSSKLHNTVSYKSFALR
jgi:hypothetical protein